MVNLLVDLPRSLAASLLSHYLGVQAIGRLDCAFCSVKLRPLFLHLLSSAEFKLTEKKILSRELYYNSTREILSCLTWCVSRCVKVRDFRWSDKLKSLDAELFAKFVRMASAGFETLQVAEIQVEPLMLEQRICFSSLKKLTWWHNHGSKELTAILSKAPALEVFRIYEHISEPGMPRIEGVLCPRVKELDLSAILTGIDLTWAAEAFPNVEDLDIHDYAKASSPHAIVFQFPRLKNLAFYASEGTNVRLLAGVCGQLTHLRLQGAVNLIDAEVEALCSA